MGYELQAQNCHAEFSYTVDTSGTTVTFTDLSYTTDSSDYITSWYWCFGDGNNSTVQNPIYTYNSQGVYNVCLTIFTNAGDTNLHSDSVYVGQSSCAGFYITGDVTNESSSGANNGAIDITVSGGTAPYTYNWSNYSLTEDLSGLSSGNYCVTVSDSNGCIATDCFDVYDVQNCHAEFSYTVDSGGTTVTFTDLSYTTDSSDYITSWYWCFGDGNNSTVQNPVHTYNSQGVYNVCLTIFTNAGDTNLYSDSVYVGQSSCAGFYITGDVTNESSSGANNGAIDITVSGGTAPYTYNWSNYSLTEDLSGLSSGNYCVTVSDSNGCMVTDCFDVYADTLSAFDTLSTSVIDTCLGFTADTAYIDSYSWVDSIHVEVIWVFQGSGMTSTTSTIYEVHQGGSYVVLVSLNCGTKTITTYSTEIYIDQYTGLGNLQSNNNQLKLYPNPANNYLNVSFQSNEKATISIFNATGQLVRQFNASTTGNTIVNVSDLQKGVYILRVKTDNSVITGRFSK